MIKHKLIVRAPGSKTWLCSCSGWDCEVPEKGAFGSTKYSARIKMLQLKHRYHVEAANRAAAKIKDNT